MCDLKELIDHAITKVGSRREVAEKLGVSQTELSYWCNPNMDRYIPLNHFYDLDALTGGWLLAKLAHNRGFDMTPREIKPAASLNVFHVVAEFTKAAGHFAYTVLEAAVDGVFTSTERRRIAQAARPLSDCVDNVHHIAGRT
jgi:hypothetical protein